MNLVDFRCGVIRSCKTEVIGVAVLTTVRSMVDGKLSNFDAVMDGDQTCFAYHANDLFRILVAIAITDDGKAPTVLFHLDVRMRKRVCDRSIQEANLVAQ